MNAITTVKDVVCGMDVDPANSAGHTDHKGQTYHFCGSKCKEKFDHNPEKYLAGAGATAKSAKVGDA
jgi:Cu+-exporting ATPase